MREAVCLKEGPKASRTSKPPHFTISDVQLHPYTEQITLLYDIRKKLYNGELREEGALENAIRRVRSILEQHHERVDPKLDSWASENKKKNWTSIIYQNAAGLLLVLESLKKHKEDGQSIKE